MRIALIAKPGHEDSGVGRYTVQLRSALEELGHEVVVVHPTMPLPDALIQTARRLLGWDLAAFFNNYPVLARYPHADVYHFTSQNLATLLLFHHPPGRTMVTVHDIIPWLLKDDPVLRIYDHLLAKWFDRMSLVGLQRADVLTADSEFTRQSLRWQNIAVDDVELVMLGVD